jgi:LysR family cys regulon transcriptional activator
MTLRQMHYICEIAKRAFNMSAAAAALHTNQSALSKQVKLLERELGTAIFIRSKNRLSGATPEGQMVIARAQTVVNEIASIKAACRDTSVDTSEPVVVGVTHTQARYVLPEIIKKFRDRYPDTPITMRDGSPSQVVDMVMTGDIAIGIAVHKPPPMRDLVILPCRRSEKVVVVPRGHALVRKKRLTLADLAQYPLVTQEATSTTGQQLLRAFKTANLSPKLALSATDSDVIKKCVELRLGIGILADRTFDKRTDIGLHAIPAGHLFEPSTTNIFLCRQRYLQRSVFNFIEACEPRWTRNRVQRLLAQAPRDGALAQP